MTRRSWVQDPETGKMIPKEEWNGPERTSPEIIGDIDPFISPIDGSIVSSRSHLRQHNAKHGVTNSADYSPEYVLKRSNERVKRAKGQTAGDREERISLIKRALNYE